MSEQSSLSPATAMEHGASERVKEESHMVMTVKAEVDKAAQCTAYHGVQTKANFTEEEPGLADDVKSEPALLVKEEVVEDDWQDIAELQCMQGPSTSAIVGSANVLDSIGDLHNILNVKEELGAIDIGPTVLQHTDTWYTTNQKDLSVVKEERTINHDKTDPILCVGVKEEIIEDKWGDSEPRIYTCDYCKKMFTHKGNMRRHIAEVHSSRSYKCHQCKNVFRCKKYLMKHTANVHNAKVHTAADTDDQRGNEAVQSKQRAQTQSYSCDNCGKTYTKKKSLREHNKNLHSSESHKCTKCNKKFPSKAYLYNHTSSAHSEHQYECAFCKKIYRSKKAMQNHYYFAHRARPAVTSPVVFMCEYCRKTYKTKRSLIYHIDVVHTKVRHRCSECKKEFKGKHLLQIHMKTVHSQEEHGVTSHVVHTCDYCHTSYASKQGLICHIDVVHTEVRYRCSECNKEYNGRHLLLGHIKKIHSKEEHEADNDAQHSNKAGQSKQRARPQLYSCDKCVKTYTSKASLMAHYRNLHSTESHKCTKCNKKFPSKNYLFNHTSSAHSEQEYECAVCKKIYRSKKAMQNHVYYAHRARPAADTDDQHSDKASQSKQRARPQLYSCDKCVQTYASKESLVQHYRNLHSTESHECTKCKKKFPSKKYLYVHTSSAHSEQQYDCAVCKKIYKSKVALRLHVRRVHRRKPAGSHQLHTCNNCGKNFDLKENCRRHEKRGKCIRSAASSTSAVASTSTQQHNVDIVKEEPADGELDLGPVVFQHMDCNYRPYKQEPGLD